MNRYFQILLLVLVCFGACKGKQVQDTSKESALIKDSTDQAIFTSIKEISKVKSLSQLDQGDRIVEMAKLFLQTPYVAGTLETGGEEKLVVNLQSLDCTTYLENVVVLSVIAQKEEFGEAEFVKELELLRYRNGMVKGYPSRLHYFSDWIFENERKGIITNVTAAIGGVPYKKNINFMSSHVGSYAALSADTTLVKVIEETESAINERENYFIPEAQIQAVEKKIENGDLIAITTKIKGLDVSHVGIAIHVNDRLHLMHASSLAKKVVISDIPLSEMLLKNKLQSGIMVARLK